MSSVATLNQTHYRIRTDTGTPDATPTWGAAQDTTFYPGQEVTFRIRFAINNTGTAASGVLIPRLSKNGGAYAAITTSSTGGVQSSASASTSADETAIAIANFRLTLGTGTAKIGDYDENGSAATTLTNGFYSEYEYGLIIKTANVAAGDVLDFRVYNSTTAFTTYTQTARIMIPSDALANDVTSASDTPTPAVSQLHILAANDIGSASTLSLPTAGEISTPQDDAWAGAWGVSWGDSWGTLAAGEDAALANDISSATSVSVPAAHQLHGLLANDVASGSSVTTAAVGQRHALLANDVASASNVGTPAVHQLHGVLANDVASASTVGSPAVHQLHVVLANDIVSASSVSAPLAGEITSVEDAWGGSWGTSWGTSWSAGAVAGEVNVFANDISSASSVSQPAVHQGHTALANDVSSASSVTQPAVRQLHVLLANNIVSASSVSTPLAGEVAAGTILAEDVVSASSVSQPAVHQAQSLLANDIVSASFVSQPAAGIVGEVTPEPEAQGGGTTSRYRKRRHVRGVMMGRKEFYELLEILAAKAAKKTAKVVGVKKLAPTQKTIIAATEDVTAAEAERLQAIWRETAVAIAELDAIDSRYWQMANALSAHFARQAQIAEMERRAREDDLDDEDVLLLAG